MNPDHDPIPSASRGDPPLDRGISPVAGRFSLGGRGKSVGIVGLLLGCGALAFATWRGEQPRSKPAPERPARQVVVYEPARPGAPTLASPGADAPALAPPMEPIVPALDPDAAASSPPAPTRPASGSPSRAPLLVYSRPGAAPEDPVTGPPNTASAPASDTELDGLRRSSRLSRAQAQSVGDRNFLLLAGATIPCTLQTALDTSTPGYVTCLIGREVYSDNGAVVLLEKGARVLGEYRTGMGLGQARIFVLWTRAVTPNGIAIALASPASDSLGRAGFGGEVDTHFWERFGAAGLLSVVDAGSEALRPARAADAGGLRLPSDAPALAVQQSGRIRPTLRKGQGGEVAIQVAQDLDFSSVYALRPRP